MHNNNNNVITVKLSYSESEYLKAAMKFHPKFDGKLRSPKDLKPLIHRNKMVHWYNRNCKVKGFHPGHGVLILINSLTDRAEDEFTKNDNSMCIDIKEFLKWFDTTYNMTNLRTKTYEMIKDWHIKKNNSKR